MSDYKICLFYKRKFSPVERMMATGRAMGGGGGGGSIVLG
jgi:hypothetical protein